jgi:hypothetical protein
MNVIDSKNWSARINVMPSVEGPTLTVFGTVIVANSAIDVSLEPSRIQDRSLGLNVDLVLQERGHGLTALTDKSVSLSVPGHVNTTHINIIHDGKVLTRIDGVDQLVNYK